MASKILTAVIVIVLIAFGLGYLQDIHIQVDSGNVNDVLCRTADVGYNTLDNDLTIDIDRNYNSNLCYAEYESNGRLYYTTTAFKAYGDTLRCFIPRDTDGQHTRFTRNTVKVCFGNDLTRIVSVFNAEFYPAQVVYSVPEQAVVNPAELPIEAVINDVVINEEPDVPEINDMIDDIVADINSGSIDGTVDDEPKVDVVTDVQVKTTTLWNVIVNYLKMLFAKLF